MRVATTRRALVGLVAGCAGVVVAALASAGLAVGAAEPQAGDAGTDISLPLTESAVTVHGRGTFADMKFTVNQTADLANQAVSITWTGGIPTRLLPSQFTSDFVQVMQCWGEPDDLVPENPGPPPEQCVWGALIPQGGGAIPGFAHAYTTSRAYTNANIPGVDTSFGTTDADSGDVYRDFVSVDGTRVTDQVNAAATDPDDQFWLNPYFDPVKTNELTGVRTLGDGTGTALFTINTGLESSGLGCGQRVQPNAGAQPTVPRCWLVIVPRGTPQAEQDDLPFQLDFGVVSSPMGPGPWENRIAIELDFTPIDSPCDINADQRRINGTELVLPAVASWQPSLCTQPGLPPYAYGIVPDQLARQQLVSNSVGAPGMVAVGRPLAAEASTPDDPIVYAPLTASAITVGFNIDRVSAMGGGEPLNGVRYAEMSLTPRLVAKLLTQSYRSQVDIDDANYLDFSASNPYDWDDDNPLVLFTDPDFQQFNPEYGLWSWGSTRNAGGLVLPGSTSDAASQLWEWILADPEATAWLAGQPDEWGMVVNPVYVTEAGANSTGFAFGTPVPDSFPKGDPYCYQSPSVGLVERPPVLCGLDWSPYVSGLGEGARQTAVANDSSKTSLNLFAVTPQDVWKSTGTQTLGRRNLLTVTDTPGLTRFGLQAARLSRAGDNGPDRQFVAPDSNSMSLAVESMTDLGGLLRVDPGQLASGAYPLTTVNYAAIRPLSLDDAARQAYGAFLDYAAGPGQVPGTGLGELPPGFLPLPSALATQTAAAADQVRTMQAPAPPAPTTTTAPTSSGAGEFTFTPSSSSGSSGRSSSTPTTVALVTPPEIPADVATEEIDTGGGGFTPISSLGVARYAIALVAAIAMVAALVALEITKRPRRASDGVPASPMPGAVA